MVTLGCPSCNYLKFRPRTLPCSTLAFLCEAACEFVVACAAILCLRMYRKLKAELASNGPVETSIQETPLVNGRATKDGAP